MGFLDRLFGKQPPVTAPEVITDDAEADTLPTRPPTIAGPPEFVRAAELHRAYWTYATDEHARLEAVGVDHLDWRELLRLHHLNCLQRLGPKPGRTTAADRCRRSARRLLADDSPYRPRPAMVWQGEAAGAADGEPHMQGVLANASLTHLGCLEVYRADADNRPTGIDFVGFDELSGVGFAPSKLIRAAKLFTDDGRGEIVLVPLLYGLTWAIGTEYDRNGRMTRFVGHMDDTGADTVGAAGMGVGQQDFSVGGADGHTLFGLGSVAEIHFPLDMRDPRFDEKARARGIDPDEARRQVR